MATYAYLYNGTVLEVIPPMLDAKGKEIPIEQRYTPEFCAALVDVTSIKPAPGQNWTFADGKFTAPPAPVPPAE